MCVGGLHLLVDVDGVYECVCRMHMCVVAYVGVWGGVGVCAECGG